MTSKTDWTVYELINLAQTHDAACERGDRKYYARKRRIGFTARKYARQKQS